MILSEDTIKILKNFSNINDSIIIEEGNRIRNISINELVYGEALVDFNFPKTFGIYNLSEFLRTLQMFKVPSLTFEEDKEYVLIAEEERNSGNITAKYNFCDIDFLTNSIKLPPNTVQMNEYLVEFYLSPEHIKKIKNACLLYDFKTISFVSKNGKIYLVVKDPRDDTSNSFSIELPEDNTSNIDFDVKIEVSALNFIETSYLVRLSQRAAEFTSIDGQIKYFTCLEEDSVFED